MHCHMYYVIYNVKKCWDRALVIVLRSTTCNPKQFCGSGNIAAQLIDGEKYITPALVSLVDRVSQLGNSLVNRLT